MTPVEKLADVLRLLPETKRLFYIHLIEAISSQMAQAKRKAFKEAENLCDGMGTMHGGTAQRIKRAIRKLAEGKE